MNEFDQLKDIPLFVFILLGSLALIQGSWIFIDARKHCSRRWHAWLWGIWGLTNIPSPLLVYLLVVHKIHLRSRSRR